MSGESMAVPALPRVGAVRHRDDLLTYLQCAIELEVTTGERLVIDGAGVWPTQPDPVPVDVDRFASRNTPSTSRTASCRPSLTA